MGDLLALAGMDAAEARAAAFAANDMEEFIDMIHRRIEAAAATPSAAAECSPMEDDATAAAAAAADEDQQRHQEDEETDEFLELELMFLRDMEQAHEEFHLHPRFDGCGGGDSATSTAHRRFDGRGSTNSTAPMEGGAVDAWAEDDMLADLDDLLLHHIKGVDAAARGHAGVVAPPPLDLELRL